MTHKGAIIAAMAAGLFSAGAPLAASAADSAKVHCQGVNSCKGKSACSTAKSGCSGQNGCKGQGLDRDDRERLQGQGRQNRQVKRDPRRVLRSRP